MEQCVNCGEAISGSPVWAVYADVAFAAKRQTAFPLHEGCYSGSEYIEAVEWVERDEPDLSQADQFGNLPHEALYERKTSRQRRYRKARSGEMPEGVTANG